VRVDLATAAVTPSGSGGGEVELVGRAPRPSYLLVFPAQAYVLDADDLGDLDADAVVAVLVARHGPDARVVVTGLDGTNCEAVVRLDHCRG